MIAVSYPRPSLGFVMAAQLIPEIAAAPRRGTPLPLGAALERLAHQLERGLISPQDHAIEKARLLASNEP